MVVGVGAFGRVYKCWDADACLVMAVKAVEIQKNKCAPPHQNPSPYDHVQGYLDKKHPSPYSHYRAQGTVLL